MQDLKNRIIAGERAAIAKAITIVESSREEDIALSHELISELIKELVFQALLVLANLHS